MRNPNFRSSLCNLQQCDLHVGLTSWNRLRRKAHYLALISLPSRFGPTAEHVLLYVAPCSICAVPRRSTGVRSAPVSPSESGACLACHPPAIVLSWPACHARRTHRFRPRSVCLSVSIFYLSIALEYVTGSINESLDAYFLDNLLVATPVC